MFLTESLLRRSSSRDFLLTPPNIFLINVDDILTTLRDASCDVKRCLLNIDQRFCSDSSQWLKSLFDLVLSLNCMHFERKLRDDKFKILNVSFWIFILSAWNTWYGSHHRDKTAKDITYNTLKLLEKLHKGVIVPRSFVPACLSFFWLFNTVTPNTSRTKNPPQLSFTTTIRSVMVQ